MPEGFGQGGIAAPGLSLPDLCPGRVRTLKLNWSIMGYLDPSGGCPASLVGGGSTRKPVESVTSLQPRGPGVAGSELLGAYPGPTERSVYTHSLAPAQFTLPSLPSALHAPDSAQRLPLYRDRSPPALCPGQSGKLRHSWKPLLLQGVQRGAGRPGPGLGQPRNRARAPLCMPGPR